MSSDRYQVLQGRMEIVFGGVKVLHRGGEQVCTSGGRGPGYCVGPGEHPPLHPGEHEAAGGDRPQALGQGVRGQELGGHQQPRVGPPEGGVTKMGVQGDARCTKDWHLDGL